MTWYQLLSCLLDFHEIRYRIFCIKQIKREFCEKSSWRQIDLYFTWGHQWISTHAFHVYSSDLGVKGFLLHSLHFFFRFRYNFLQNMSTTVIKRLWFCEIRRSGSRFELRVDKWTLFLVSTLIFPFGLISLQIIIIIGIQPLGRSGQRPELSQATGMSLVRCILGKFLGVVCHCFPPRLEVPTFVTRCPHARHDARDPSGGRWNLWARNVR